MIVDVALIWALLVLYALGLWLSFRYLEEKETGSDILLLKGLLIKSGINDAEEYAQNLTSLSQRWYDIDFDSLDAEVFAAFLEEDFGLFLNDRDDLVLITGTFKEITTLLKANLGQDVWNKSSLLC